jgi:hypothetical protein
LNEQIDVTGQVPNCASEADVPRPPPAEAPGSERGHRQLEPLRNFLFGHRWNLVSIHTIVLALVRTGADHDRCHHDGQRADATPGWPKGAVKAEAASADGAERRALTAPRAARQSQRAMAGFAHQATPNLSTRSSSGLITG